MTARSDIRVLDATIRDGGLVNNFMFSDDFINALYRTNVKAGVDYMEFGYKASKELFDVNKFGKWKFCDEESIREIVGDNNSDMKIFPSWQMSDAAITKKISLTKKTV